jgi:hypothetical protein
MDEDLQMDQDGQAEHAEAVSADVVAGGRPGDRSVSDVEVVPGAVKASQAGASPGPADDDAPAPSLRYTRRRVLVLGGAFVAGAVAVIGGLRALGSPSATSGGSSMPSGGGSGGAYARFPVRSVDAVPDVPADQWTVKVDGLVDRPFTIGRAEWAGLTRMAETVDFNCVEGWTVTDCRWGGVAPSLLLQRAGVRPEARYVVVHAQTGAYFSTLPLDLMTHPKTMLADTLGGEPLPPEHGGPLRLVVPVQLGYKNVKWVDRLEVTDDLRKGYWESYGYPEDAPAPGV